MQSSLCELCSHKKDVISGTGSRFLLCVMHQTDQRFPKYPPQPVIRCNGYEPGRDEGIRGS